MENLILLFDLGDLFGWNPRFIFLTVLVVVGLGLFFLQMLVRALFGALIFGLVGSWIAGETGAGIGAAIGFLGGIIGTFDDLENKNK